jgi:hypothetical protein
MHPDEIRRIYVLARALVVITAAVVLAGVLAGSAAPFTGRAEADGSFALAFMGGAAFVLLRGGYRWELRAGAASSRDALALAADRTMWILLGLSLGGLAGVKAVTSYPNLELVALSAIVGVAFLAKGAHSAWQARRYVTAIA